MNGETSLKNYKGWIKKPKSATVIEQMIGEYIETRTKSMQEDDASAADVTLVEGITNSIGRGDNVNMFA